MHIQIITHSTENGLNANLAEKINKHIESLSDVVLNPELVNFDGILKCDALIMIVPEWNGSFPYSFKKMIDDSRWPSIFKEKSIFLIGTSHSEFGNVIGVSHLEHTLQWCGAKVYHKKVYIPMISLEISVYQKRIVDSIDEFIKQI